MGRRENDSAVYSSAQAGSFVRDDLEGKTPKWIHEYAPLVSDDDTLDLLNYRSSLFAEDGEDYTESHEAEIILESASTRTMRDAFQEGNVSVLQGSVGLVNHSKDATDGFDIVVDHLMTEGAIVLFVGPPGTGKTSMMADCLRAAAAKKGAALVSNMDWDGNDVHVSTDWELLTAMGEIKGPVIGGLDELSRELTGRGADAKQAEMFAQALTLIRKKEAKHGPYAKQGAIAAVAHTLKRLAASLRRMATLVVQKPTPKDPGKFVLYESEGGDDTLERIGEFDGLTDTRERLDEHEASEFRVVGEPDDSEGESDDEPSADEIRKQEQIATAIRAVEPWSDESGMSYTDAARLVDYADSWVGDRVREWKRGEWRDLVAEPDGVIA